MRTLLRAFVVTVSCLASALAHAQSSRLSIPARPAGALTGSQFMRSTARMDEAAREEAIFREIARGNVPSFLRELKPVTMSSASRGGPVKATVWVMPDYLAIGSDRDFVRVPMTPVTAQRLADRFGAMLPTVKVVDEVNRQAEVRLKPAPMSVRGQRMKTSDAYQRHNELVERQRRGRPLGKLTSGHKKDVVITNRLASRPNQVAIYGWHQGNGRPIQPLSLVHHNHYADYSHGIRLVSRRAVVDGRTRDLDEVLRDARTASVASNEGRMVATRAKIANVAPAPSYARGRHSVAPRKTKLARYHGRRW